MGTYTRSYSLTDGTTAYGSQVAAELDSLGNSVNNIVNAQISSGAAISDTKLAQITTASKVSSVAITGDIGISELSNVAPIFGAYRNLKIVRTSVTQVTVTADELCLQDSSNDGIRIVSINEPIAITSSGAGGLDTGAEGSSRWYYIWIIRKSSDGTVDGLLSESSSAPTMPSGYDQKALVSAVYNNASSNFVDFVDEGFSYVYKEDRQLFSGSYSNNAPMSYLGSGTGDSGTYAYGKYSVGVTAQHSWLLPITTANTIYYCTSGTTWASIDLTGFVPSVFSTLCYGAAQSSGGTGTISLYGFFKNKTV